MEVQQFEFDAVNMSASSRGNAQLELSSSSCNASSTDSSFQSSPLSAFCPSPPPAIRSPSDLHLQEAADPSCAIVISSCPPPRFLTREQALKSLKDSIPHQMKLRQLQKSERAHGKDARFHKQAVRRTSEELYQIASLYALLQGVLFTAVAQSSIFTCTDTWGPVGVVCLVTLGTIAGALDKLRRMGHQKQEVKKFEGRQIAVSNKIDLLYFRGSECNIEDAEPEHRENVHTDPGTLCIFSAHGLLVVGFLVGFSVLITTSCILMLCKPCSCGN